MGAWWEALTVFQRILCCIAIPSTLILVIQTVLMVVGFGDGGSDFNPSDTSGLDLDVPDIPDIPDVDGGVDVDLPDSDAQIGKSGELGTIRLFTFQGIIAFATTFSWATLAFLNVLPGIAAVMSGIACGFVMMYVVAKILQLSSKLAENGTFNAKSVIGEVAQVYIPVLPNGAGGGKVTLCSSSRFVELSAVTEEKEMIPSGNRVRIIDVRGEAVVVERDS